MIVNQPFKDFNIIWTKDAQKQLKLLVKKDQEKIAEKVGALIGDFNSLDIKKLQGFQDSYRIRSGSYRVVYKVDSSQKILKITVVEHRKDVYKVLRTLIGIIGFEWIQH